jgi:hypothetical protein
VNILNGLIINMGNKRNLTEIMYSCTTYPNTELYRRLYPYAEQSGKFLITRKTFISPKAPKVVSKSVIDFEKVKVFTVTLSD